MSPLASSFGFSGSFLVCEEETPQLYSLFFHDGRQAPGATLPQRFRGKPSSILGDIQGPPYPPPPALIPPASRPGTRLKLLSAHAGVGQFQVPLRGAIAGRSGSGGGCWSALNEGVLPQATSKLGHTTSSCIPAGRAEEPGGMRSSVVVAGAGPRLSPGLPCSPGPSEDSEMQWDTPGWTEGP